VKSRSKEGGLRVGEMESAVILSQGLSGFLQESMMERSDKYNYYVDDVSGDIAVANPQKGIMRSLSEPSSLEFSHIQTPFATKLMLQELESMSIMPRIITNDLEPSDNERSMEEYIGDLETIDEVNEQDDE